MSLFLPVSRRIFAGVLLLGVGLAVFAACNDNGDDGGAGDTPAADETPGGGETPADGDGAMAEIKMLPGVTFDKEELTITADTDVTITADNTDGFHNFAVYSSEEAPGAGEDPIAETPQCSDPCTESITVNLAAGEYFFRCEVHPSIMTGVLTVE